MMILGKTTLFFHSAGLLLLVWSLPVSSDIEQVQALDFGTLVVLKNDEVESFRLGRNGNVSFSDAFLIFSPPQRAIFSLSELPADSVIRVSAFVLDPVFTSASLNTERFTFDELDFLPIINSDINGEAQVFVGGQISTSGDGSTNFGTFPLSAGYRFTIDF